LAACYSLSCAYGPSWLRPRASSVGVAVGVRAPCARLVLTTGVRSPEHNDSPALCLSRQGKWVLRRNPSRAGAPPLPAYGVEPGPSTNPNI